MRYNKSSSKSNISLSQKTRKTLKENLILHLKELGKKKRTTSQTQS